MIRVGYNIIGRYAYIHIYIYIQISIGLPFLSASLCFPAGNGSSFVLYHRSSFTRDNRCYTLFRRTFVIANATGYVIERESTHTTRIKLNVSNVRNIKLLVCFLSNNCNDAEIFCIKYRLNELLHVINECL